MKMFFLISFFLFFSFFDIIYFFIFFLSLLLLIFFGMTMNFFGGLFFFDMVSFFLMILTMYLLLFCFLSNLKEKWTNNKDFLYFLVLYMIFFLLMVCFMSSSIFLFYVSFEMIFMFMFMFLLSWGYSPERLQASFYMVFYTIVVSFPFLIFMTLIESELMMIKFNMYINLKMYWWMFMFLIFLVKLPVYSVHLWLAKAHVEAPVTGSMLLAGVLLKLGGYGILRFIPLVTCQMFIKTGYLFSLGILGSILSTWLCLKQSDLKLLIAYSSVCHMSISLSSIFSISEKGKEGTILMLVSHGYVSSCLFYISYLLYEQYSSRSIILIKGIVSATSSLSFFFLIFCSMNMGIPPFLSFFSEVLMSVATLSLNFSNSIIFMVFLFFSGTYCIVMYISICHGNTLFHSLKNVTKSNEFLLIYGHFFPLLFFPFYIDFFYSY